MSKRDAARQAAKYRVRARNAETRLAEVENELAATRMLLALRSEGRTQEELLAVLRHLVDLGVVGSPAAPTGNGQRPPT